MFVICVIPSREDNAIPPQVFGNKFRTARAAKRFLKDVGISTDTPGVAILPIEKAENIQLLFAKNKPDWSRLDKRKAASPARNPGDAA